MTKYIVFFLLCVVAISVESWNSYQFPKMVIFGLDKTLWPFTIGTDLFPPFKKQNISVSNSNIVDSQGHVFSLYPDTLKVLDYLMENNIRMAIASKTKHSDGVRQLCSMLGLDKYFHSKMMYSTTHKDKQVKRISYRCHVPLKDMLFFDDQQRNIYDLEHIGVVSIILLHGITMSDLNDGFVKYSDRKAGASEKKLKT